MLGYKSSLAVQSLCHESDKISREYVHNNQTGAQRDLLSIVDKALTSVELGCGIKWNRVTTACLLSLVPELFFLLTLQEFVGDQWLIFACLGT